MLIDSRVDYDTLPGMSHEVRQRLKDARPETLVSAVRSRRALDRQTDHLLNETCAGSSKTPRRSHSSQLSDPDEVREERSGEESRVRVFNRFRLKADVSRRKFPSIVVICGFATLAIFSYVCAAILFVVSHANLAHLLRIATCSPVEIFLRELAPFLASSGRRGDSELYKWDSSKVVKSHRLAKLFSDLADEAKSSAEPLSLSLPTFSLAGYSRILYATLAYQRRKLNLGYASPSQVSSD